MITQAPSALGNIAGVAAATVAATLASSEPLTVGEPTRELDLLEHGFAVVAGFTGSASGDFALVVDAELQTALAESPLGSLELADALAPTLQAIVAALETVTLGRVQSAEARLAVHRVLGHDEAIVLPLLGASSVRAAVIVGLDTPAEKANGTGDVRADRLDLLRGVEMDVQAELGRTRMTVNDLLQLRAGAIIELDRPAGAPVDLLVNGRLIAHGEVVVIDENYALRITQVVSDEGR